MGSRARKVPERHGGLPLQSTPFLSFPLRNQAAGNEEGTRRQRRVTGGIKARSGPSRSSGTSSTFQSSGPTFLSTPACLQGDDTHPRPFLPSFPPSLPSCLSVLHCTSLNSNLQRKRKVRESEPPLPVTWSMGLLDQRTLVPTDG